MITNQLPRLMAQRGVSIRQLSRDTAITYSTIWALVNSQRRSVQLEVLDAICAALAVQPGDIYGYVGGDHKPAESAELEAATRRPGPRTRSSERPARPATKHSSGDWRSW